MGKDMDLELYESWLAAQSSDQSSKSLIGRDAEQKLLCRHLDMVLKGRTTTVMIAGEPGVGKTFLVDWLAAEVMHGEVTVLKGGASNAQGMPPYLPFLEALGQYIRSAPTDELRLNTVGLEASVLSTILPELPERIGQPATVPDLPPDQGRMRLYRSVASLLAAIARRTPTMLVLDDLQWADADSLEMLSEAVRYQPSIRLLIVGIYRASEVENNPALVRALAELNRKRMLTTVTVNPLSSETMSEFASNYLGSEVQSAVAQVLHEQSQGNAFFAEELLRGWLQSGALRSVDGQWQWASGDKTVTPPSIFAAIRQRLSYLPPAVVDRLRVAAIVGRSFDSVLLARLASEDVEEVESGLAVACASGLVRQNGDESYVFSHDMTRECLYAEVSAARRKRVHEAIGRLLEANPDSGSPQRLADLAFHFAHSGDRNLGALYLEQAGDLALKTYAAEQAAAYYRATLDRLDYNAPRTGSVWLRLGESLLQSDDLEQAFSVYRTAEEECLRRHEVAEAGTAVRGQALAKWRLKALPEARDLFQEALTLLGDQRQSETTQVLIDLATLLGVDMQRPAEGILFGRRALGLAQHLGNDHLITAASRIIGYVLVRENDRVAGLPLLNQARVLAEKADNMDDAAECCAYLANAYYWTAQLEDCLEATHQRISYATRGHEAYHLANARTYLGFVYVHRGEWREAERALEESRPRTEQLSGPIPRVFAQQVRGFLEFQRGEYTRAAEMLREALAVLRAIRTETFIPDLGLLTVADASCGQREEATGHMAELEEMISLIPPSGVETSVALNCLALAAMALGDNHRAMGLHARLLKFEGLHEYFLVDRVLGLLETLKGDFSAARMHLERAETVARCEGLHPELARTFVAQARLAIAHVDGAEELGSGLLAKAISLFEKFQMHKEAALARQELLLLDTNPAVPAPLATPAGLSPRHIEILRLIAAGKSNRAIGESLFISEKTVANHLTTIYTKTGTDNRAGAVAYALRHALI